jgi:hypothetical protein
MRPAPHRDESAVRCRIGPPSDSFDHDLQQHVNARQAAQAFASQAAGGRNVKDHDSGAKAAAASH